MVETLGPSGCDLNSHLSDQRGQMSALNNGARMGILAVLGTHVEDYSLLVKKYIYIYTILAYHGAPATWPFSQTRPAILIRPTEM